MEEEHPDQATLISLSCQLPPPFFLSSFSSVSSLSSSLVKPPPSLSGPYQGLSLKDARTHTSKTQVTKHQTRSQARKKAQDGGQDGHVFLRMGEGRATPGPIDHRWGGSL